MSINKALDDILENRLDEMRNNFTSALSQKAMQKLEERKIEIAQAYFGQVQEGNDPLQDKADYLNSPTGRNRKPGIKDKKRKKKDMENYGKAANTWWSVKKNKLNPKRLPEE